MIIPHSIIDISIDQRIIIDMLKNLGQRIRSLRKEKGLTLVEVSQKTGIAQATLSRIETGTMMGTVDSHEKMAQVLGVGLPELYSGVDGRYEQLSHLTKASDRKVTHHSRNVQIELLTSESSKKKITPLLLTLQGESETGKEHQERGVEKFIYVLEGEVKAKIDKEEFVLNQGETLYFDASFTHQFINEKTKAAKLLLTGSPSKI